jgi:hypothetical protein
MDINRDAPATTEGGIEIAADSESVWGIIAAIEDWPSWNPEVKSVQLDGPVAPGTTFRWKAGPGTITSRLEVVDRPREIAWSGKTMGIKAIHAFRFEPKGGGRSPGPRSHGRVCWRACSRGTAARP